MKRVEFWYDIVCPYAYLGFTQIERIAQECGAEVDYRPFLLGGVFKALEVPSNLAASMPAAKQQHGARDLMRWADYFHAEFNPHPQHPIRSVLAMRALLAAGKTGRKAATEALYRAYWVDNLNISEPETVARVLSQAGLDGAHCVAQTQEPAIKQALRTCTDEAIAKGIFGAPTLFVGDEMFWGQDRLDFVARALQAA